MESPNQRPEEEGFCEIIAISSEARTARIRFYLSPVEYIEEKTSTNLLDHRELPSQSRCALEVGAAQVLGRVLVKQVCVGEIPQEMIKEYCFEDRRKEKTIMRLKTLRCVAADPAPFSAAKLAS